MKIKYLQISNILSFGFESDIANATKIEFAPELNIIIGENGAGKSTALEVLNFLFRRVFYKQYTFNADLYQQRQTMDTNSRRQILMPVNSSSSVGFRLEPNWSCTTSAQMIRLCFSLDDIDKDNLNTIKENADKIRTFIGSYSSGWPLQHPLPVEVIDKSTGIPTPIPYLGNTDAEQVVDVTIQPSTREFTVVFNGSTNSFITDYLQHYNFLKEAIERFNDEDSQKIGQLRESYSIISSFRNYSVFSPSISLSNSTATTQINQIRDQEYRKSVNASDNSEPSIFSFVRLQVADKHFKLFDEPLTPVQKEEAANKSELMSNINKHLKSVNLSAKVRLLDPRTWQYSFELTDTLRNRQIADINSLSAGQKSILHLVFESFGRGQMKGGVVIVDEPEIHLHYQFQHEYLRILEQLSKETSCQYILVTHSESLINSHTVDFVIRFSMNPKGFSVVNKPSLDAEKKLLIKILDNTRSVYALFAKKVVLVEGDSDRYFFRAALLQLYPDLDQEIAILHTGSKTSHKKWREVFEDFGLQVFEIWDLDYSFNLFYPCENQYKLKDDVALQKFIKDHPDLSSKIEAGYLDRKIVLKKGDLERYLSIQKDLSNVIDFCNSHLTNFLAQCTNPYSAEIKGILQRITA